MKYGALAQRNYEKFDLGVDAKISFEREKGSNVGQLNIRSIVRSEPYSFKVVLKRPQDPLHLTAKDAEKKRVFEAMSELFSNPEYKEFKGDLTVYGSGEQPVSRSEADWLLRNSNTVFSLSAGRPNGVDSTGRPVIEKSEINSSYGWARLCFYAFQDGAEAEGLYVKLSASITKDLLLDTFGDLQNMERP